MTAELTEQEIAEFWRRVEVGDPEACWPWTAGTGNGYGEVRLAGVRGAHRVAWSLENGPIPDGYHVRHLCDGPKLCCNPAHLDAAPPRINARDRAIHNLANPCPRCGEQDRRETDNRCRGCVRRAGAAFRQRQCDGASRARVAVSRGRL